MGEENCSEISHALKGEGGHSLARGYPYFLFNLFNLIFLGARQFSSLSLTRMDVS